MVRTEELYVFPINLMSITIKAMRIGTVEINTATSLSIPTPPGPPGYPFCQWELVWSKQVPQSGTTYIPLIFAID